MPSREVIKTRVETKKEQLELANDAYSKLLSGQVQSYAIGSRNLSRFDLPKIEDSIKKLEKEIDSLEEQLRGGKKRKAVGVIPRDF